MGWVEDESRERRESSEQVGQSQAERHFRSLEEQKWDELVRGFEQDAQEFRRVDGDAVFSSLSDFQCRISNPRSGVAVIVTVDIPAHMVRYEYQAEAENIAVPEGGVLSLRTSDGVVSLFSADQRLMVEEARRLVLEPLLFPPPTQQDLQPTGT